VQQTVWVVETNGEEAVVELRRHAACDHCGACWTGDPRRFAVDNPHRLPSGRRVVIELPDGGFLAAAFLVYGLPLLCGAVVACFVAGMVPAAGDGMVGLAFLGGVAGAFAGLNRLDRAGRFHRRYRPVIVGDAPDEDDEVSS